MKLVRYGNPGKEKPGLIDADGKLRDLSAVVKDIGPEQLGDAALAKIRKLKTDKLPLVKGSPRMGCPVANIGKYVAIGLNYRDHAAEAGMPVPKEPIIFMKATNCIQGPNDDVMLELPLRTLTPSFLQFIRENPVNRQTAAAENITEFFRRAEQTSGVPADVLQSLLQDPPTASPPKE